MTDLNVMMREQAKMGLQTELDAAVTNGDTAAARTITDKLAALAVSTAPKAPPYGDVEIRAELDKQAWFGVDPKKTNRAVAMGRDMDPKKFATAELFAAALLKAVDEEFKPAAPEGEEPGGEEPDDEGEDKTSAAGEKKPRRTDGPREGESGAGTGTRRTSGPWTKLSDAPPEIQKEIKRQADKMVPTRASKEQREAFITRTLGSHYEMHQRSKGKK